MDGLQGSLKLCVAHVGLVGVVVVGVAVAHEQHGTHLGILVEVGIERRSQFFGVVLGVHERHTQFEGHGLHVGIVQVAEDIVAKVLHGVDHAAELFARNHLHRLHDDFLILHTAESLEPVFGFVERTLGRVLACGCTVDADGRREGEEHVVVGECLLILLTGQVESIVGLLPGRAEGHEQQRFLVCLLGTYGVLHFLLITFHVRQGVVVVVAAGRESCRQHHGSQCHDEKLNLLHRFDF